MSEFVLQGPRGKMSRMIPRLLFAAAVAASVSAVAAVQAPPPALLIAGVTLVDGTGAPPRAGVDMLAHAAYLAWEGSPPGPEFKKRAQGDFDNVPPDSPVIGRLLRAMHERHVALNPTLWVFAEHPPADGLAETRTRLGRQGERLRGRGAVLRRLERIHRRTHANCRALVPGNLRCKTDEMIRKMAKTGGVMGIGFLRFLNRPADPVTLDDVLDHFDHVARLAGVQHVAVGSDLDVAGNANAVNGGGFQPSSQPNFARYQYHADAEGRITVKGLDHPKRMFDLAEGLIRRGYSDADIGLILGGNAARVLSTIWTRA
jgi:hypothetical protein